MWSFGGFGGGGSSGSVGAKRALDEYEFLTEADLRGVSRHYSGYCNSSLYS